MAISGQHHWGISGFTQRSGAVVGQLRPQDNLYAILEKSPDRLAARVVGSITESLFPGEETAAAMQRLCDPRVRIVSLTITEKGYRLDPAGSLILDDATKADARAARRGDRHTPPGSAIGLLGRGLIARAAAGAGPLAVMSCDNMVDNGELLRRQVEAFVDLVGRSGAALEEVSFVSTVVDRMVPTTGDRGRAEVAETIGLRDEGAVLTEPYWQWVLQDRFPAGRPDWPAVGVVLAEDVRPYELLKLRVLNASHSLLAYLGALAGFETIAATVAVPEFEEAAWSLINHDVIPSLNLPADLDPVAYAHSVMERYRNHALGHQTGQVTMDGSQKLPQRLIPTAEAALKRGDLPRSTALTYAAWMEFVRRGESVDGRPLILSDPRADELREAARGPAATLVDRFLGVPGLFSRDLAENATWRGLLCEAMDAFTSDRPQDWTGF